ncbi:MAG: hypothetical protein P1V51_08515 [Deltaproteobacteria bacterium]|nr:hypothetical protein [Deltaproteobacteria bacterium]
MRRHLSILLLLPLLLLGGCPSGDDDGHDGGAGDGAVTDGGGGDAGSDGGLPGPYTTCDEGGLADCFSNHDCQASEVCRDVGVAPDHLPCCVPGVRGTLAAGEACDPVEGETQCASSLCLEDTAAARCTDRCVADADCPTGMQLCTEIVFSGSSDRWCLFE